MSHPRTRLPPALGPSFVHTARTHPFLHLSLALPLFAVLAPCTAAPCYSEPPYHITPYAQFLRHDSLGILIAFWKMSEVVSIYWHKLPNKKFNIKQQRILANLGCLLFQRQKLLELVTTDSYHLSILTILASIVTKLEMIQCNFLWGDEGA